VIGNEIQTQIDSELELSSPSQVEIRLTRINRLGYELARPAVMVNRACEIDRHDTSARDDPDAP
jgi:hypothetical protein